VHVLLFDVMSCRYREETLRMMTDKIHRVCEFASAAASAAASSPSTAPQPHDAGAHQEESVVP
jgi:hypothetical protein